eukprot:c7363_g1_i1.p1 GENE.c7363_g1_i1~~c7363_g1_i1.p1  ORF type:complete len:334 (+),score=78.55 c7363_g1_i1:50-1051(+)
MSSIEGPNIEIPEEPCPMISFPAMSNPLPNPSPDPGQKSKWKFRSGETGTRLGDLGEEQSLNSAKWERYSDDNCDRIEQMYSQWRNGGYDPNNAKNLITAGRFSYKIIFGADGVHAQENTQTNQKRRIVREETSAQRTAELEKRPPSWVNCEIPDGDFKKFDVPITSQEGKDALKNGRFYDTMTGKQVVKIERIQNPHLWIFYAQRKARLLLSARNAGGYNEQWLWHGSKAIDDICQQGVDFRLANSGRMWGNGSYFAKNASYSDDYAATTNDGKSFFLCRVALGTIKSLPSDSNLKKPPSGSDSVQGNTNGSDVFIVYELHASYPEYLITYR